MITAYALAFGSLLLLGGRIADLFGRKWTFIAGLLGFAGASAVGGAAQSFGVLVAARALQGAFAAMLAPAALSLLTTTFTDPAERGKAFGVYAAIAGTGGAIGLLLGGALTEMLDWRWCLYVVDRVRRCRPRSPACACCTTCPCRAGRGSTSPGTLTASSGLFALVFGLSRAETDGWGEPVTIGFLAAAARPAGRVRRPAAARRAPAAAAAAWSPTATAAPRSSRSRTASAGIFGAVPVPDVLPPEHEGPERARDRPRVPADELLDLAAATVVSTRVLRPHRAAAARARRDAAAPRSAWRC